MNNSKEMAALIKRLLDEKNISANKALKECGLNKDTLVNMNRQKDFPTIDKVAKLAEYLDVSTDYILGITDIKKHDSQATDLTAHETELVKAYRAQPDMQKSIDRILGINKEIESEFASEINPDIADAISAFSNAYAKKPTDTK